jgi:predicted TIM-barrel fold metal-dependent hydrolase
MNALREALLQEMATQPVVDCHAHTHLKSSYYESGPFDLFTLGSYFDREAGALSERCPLVEVAGQSLEERRWARLREMLKLAGNESYWRHNLVVYRDLFGMAGEDLTDDNWAAVNARIKACTADPEWYHEVTVNRCRLRTQVKNIQWFHDWEPEYFTAILRMEPALELYNPGPRRQLEEYLGRELRCLRDLREALSDLVARYVARGAKGIKLAHAYRRTLQSEPVPEVTAATLFDRALRGEKLPWSEAKRLEDYVIYFLAGLCTEGDLIFDLHTGVQGNGCWIPDSNPLLLLNLIRDFPRTRFNLYHGGYPWSREIGMMGKHFGNVWLNMAWMYVISMEASRQALSEWLDLVPGYRILGFGSDVNFPEMIYGHLAMAKSCLADVLARKVKHDFLSAAAARDLARGLLYDHAVELYGLGAG